MTNNTIGREQLLSQQDIHNIQCHLDLDSITKNANNLISTSAGVEDMRAMPYNPVLIFKQQGEQQSDTMDNLANDDFLLALQT